MEPSLERVPDASAVDEATIADVTTLLHRAYAPLAARGMRYLASHQPNTTTRKRMADGTAFLARLGPRIVGTITFYPPGRHGGCDWYERDDVASFGQFAVDPDLQGRGIARALLALVEAEARAVEVTHLACDTSEHASELIGMYARRGFEIVGSTKWNEVNYRSVIMSKRLR